MTQTAIATVPCATCKRDVPIDQANEHVLVDAQNRVTGETKHLCQQCDSTELDTVGIAQNTTYDDDLLRSVDLGSHELKELKDGSVVFWNEQERVQLDREEAYYALVTLQAMFREDQESFQTAAQPTCDDDDEPDPIPDPSPDDAYGEDCPNTHACTPNSTSPGSCIAGPKGHANQCLCGKCGTFF